MAIGAGRALSQATLPKANILETARRERELDLREDAFNLRQQQLQQPEQPEPFSLDEDTFQTTHRFFQPFNEKMTRQIEEYVEENGSDLMNNPDKRRELNSILRQYKAANEAMKTVGSNFEKDLSEYSENEMPSNMAATYLSLFNNATPEILNGQIIYRAEDGEAKPLTSVVANMNPQGAIFMPQSYRETWKDFYKEPTTTGDKITQADISKIGKQAKTFVKYNLEGRQLEDAAIEYLQDKGYPNPPQSVVRQLMSNHLQGNLNESIELNEDDIITVSEFRTTTADKLKNEALSKADYANRQTDDREEGKDWMMDSGVRGLGAKELPSYVFGSPRGVTAGIALTKKQPTVTVGNIGDPPKDYPARVQSVYLRGGELKVKVYVGGDIKETQELDITPEVIAQIEGQLELPVGLKEAILQANPDVQKTDSMVFEEAIPSGDVNTDVAPPTTPQKEEVSLTEDFEFEWD